MSLDIYLRKVREFPDPPSEDFEESFSSSMSGCVRTCVCGRTLFDTHNTYDWEEGELEGLLKKANEQPSLYIPFPYSVSTMIVYGMELVMGCPCNAARGYEQFIIKHASQIADYLNKRAKNLADEAERCRVKVSETR